ncbi:MAG: TonB-dependent receptor [Sphingomonadales bacterium]
MTIKRASFYRTALAGTACLLMHAPATIAQTTAQDGETARQSAGLEEILVTATRRVTALQSTPVSVTAVSAADLDAMVPENIGDVAYLVPNFTAAKVTGFNAASFSIRGVGQTDIIVYSEPQVGVIVDDFVVPHVQSQLLEPFDIERIEVLRGPQGTLFGKNTTAGAVRVVTKRPELDEFGIEGALKFARFNDLEGRLALNIPLVKNTLGFRFAGIYQSSDGFYRNGAAFGPVVSFDPNSPLNGLTGQGDNRRIGGADVFSGRAKLLWKPNDDLSVLLQYENLRDNSDSVPAFNDSPDSFLFGGVLGFNTPQSNALEPSNPLKRSALTNRDDQLLNMSKGHQVDIDGVHLSVEYQAGALTFNSVTGYRDQRSSLPSTFTGEVGPVSLFDANRSDSRETFQQEIRVSSNFEGPVQFVAGGFYQNESIDFCVMQVLGFLDVLGTPLPFGTFNNNPQILCNAQSSDSWAVFGDVTWEVTDKLTVSGGVRGTFDSKDWTGRNQVFVQALPAGGFDPDFTADVLGRILDGADFERFPNGVVTSSKNWEKATWRLSTSYQFTPDVFSFFTYSRGFRAGAFNDQTGTSGLAISPAQAAAVDPETVDSFELGIKSELFDRQLRVNVTGFYQQFDDAQRSIVATIVNQFGEQFQETRFFNAATINVKGIELETTWTPIENLFITGVVGWLDGGFGSFEADTDFDGTPDIDFSDRPLNRAPEWQATVAVAYTHPVLAGNLTWNGSFNYEAKSINIFSDLSRDFDSILNARELLNFNLTYRDAEDRYFIRAFAKNLLNDRYRVSGQPVANLFTFSQFGQPITGGIEIGFSY